MGHKVCCAIVLLHWDQFLVDFQKIKREKGLLKPLTSSVDIVMLQALKYLGPNDWWETLWDKRCNEINILSTITDLKNDAWCSCHCSIYIGLPPGAPPGAPPGGTAPKGAQPPVPDVLRGPTLVVECGGMDEEAGEAIFLFLNGLIHRSLVYSTVVQVASSALVE